MDSAYQGVFKPFKNEVMQLSNIKGVAASSNVMGQEDYWTNGYLKVNDPNHSVLTLYNLGMDYNFISDYNLKMVAGRNFSKDFGTDSSAVLLNETVIQQLNFGTNISLMIRSIIFSSMKTSMINMPPMNYSEKFSDYLLFSPY